VSLGIKNQQSAPLRLIVHNDKFVFIVALDDVFAYFFRSQNSQ
jgi:hypothetical protein